MMANKHTNNTSKRNQNVKHEIRKIKHRLETAFDIDTITRLENAIAVAEGEIL